MSLLQQFSQNYEIQIKCDNQNIIYMKEIDNDITLICFFNDKIFEKKGLIDYNIMKLKEAYIQIIKQEKIIL